VRRRLDVGCGWSVGRRERVELVLGCLFD